MKKVIGSAPRTPRSVLGRPALLVADWSDLISRRGRKTEFDQLTTAHSLLEVAPKRFPRMCLSKRSFNLGH